MKKHRFLTWFTLLIISVVNAYSQQDFITGEVLDNNGDPLIGVTIQLKGTSTGTITDIDGKFSIQASFVPVRFPKPHGKGFPLSKISPSRSSALAAGKHPVPAPNHHSPHSRAIRLKKSAAEKPRRLDL